MRTFGCVLYALIITGCQPVPEESQVLQAGIGPRPASGAVDRALDDQSSVRVRRLWNQPPNGFNYMSPAPNGTFVTIMDGSTGDLAIMDFQSQTLRRVTNKGTWSESSDYAETSVVSPDNSQIAYAWNVQSGNIGYELRVIGVDKKRTAGSAHTMVLPRTILSGDVSGGDPSGADVVSDVTDEELRSALETARIT